MWEKVLVPCSPTQTVTPVFLATVSMTLATYRISSLVLAMIITWGLGSFTSTLIIAGIPNDKVFPDPLVA